jgi:hypothetical protein
MIVSELKEALRARGALTNGSKAVLVERLLAAEEAQVVDAEGAEEEDAEEDTDEVLMRQCTCNGEHMRVTKLCAVYNAKGYFIYFVKV